ncbi:MAG: aminotransferase class IV [Thermaurantiacus sp.]
MTALAMVDGQIGPVAGPAVAVEDRGLQFGDAVYEVVAFLNGRLFDWEKHLWRLQRGAAAIGFTGLPSAAVIAARARRLMRASRVTDGLLYIQATRGSGRRDHVFPIGDAPTLIMTARRFDFRQRVRQQEVGVALLTLPDQRWKRCDIKSTNLLPAVLAKEEARRAGAFEAMFVTEQGVVTEGASTNLWMVEPGGRLRTHPLSAAILPGVSRDTVMALARGDGLEVDERAFPVEEARAAPELFLTSTTGPLLPITTLDGAAVGDGAPGPITRRLVELLWRDVRRQTGWRASGLP